MDPRGNMESAALTKDGLAYLMNQVEDFTYQLRYWPPYYKDMLMCNHLYYTGRFQLTIFLLGNRLSPITIAEWYLGRNQLKNAAATPRQGRADCAGGAISVGHRRLGGKRCGAMRWAMLRARRQHGTRCVEEERGAVAAAVGFACS